ncbi:hypothetical protein E2C01_034777 [Portunus trituberculatus]|uniref:Uncharacterized protein n=1 Tax=Portunus trituberculatus TaxID=210409 RepID=A0A5B7F2E6_PORTR|nr:hypothetical protein [Portunus trituberculatus]
MADSDVRGSEMTEGSEPDVKSLRDLVIRLVQAMSEMKQETNGRMDKMASELKQEMSKMAQETNVRMDEIRQEIS